MTESKRVCEVCGRSATVHVSNVVGGVSTMRHFCEDCVDVACIDAPNPPRQWAAAAVLGSIGLVVLLLSVFADWLRLGSAAGFGWYQQTGVVVGAVVLLLGAVARVPTLLILGMFACVLSILADWFAFGSAEGFGWQQILGTALGALLIIAALIVSRSKASPEP